VRLHSPRTAGASHRVALSFDPTHQTRHRYRRKASSQLTLPPQPGTRTGGLRLSAVARSLRPRINNHTNTPPIAQPSIDSTYCSEEERLVEAQLRDTHLSPVNPATSDSLTLTDHPTHQDHHEPVETSAAHISDVSLLCETRLLPYHDSD
jgi:hypothetical protein